MTIADVFDRVDAWWSRRDLAYRLDAAVERAFLGDVTYGSRPVPAPPWAGRDNNFP